MIEESTKLTYRDRIALDVMKILVERNRTGGNNKWIAEQSYELADLMIEEKYKNGIKD